MKSWISLGLSSSLWKEFWLSPQERLGKLQIISIGTYISVKIVTSQIPWQSFLDAACEHRGVLGVWISPFSANLVPPSPSQEGYHLRLEREVRSRSTLPHLDLGHFCRDKRSRVPDTRAFPLAPYGESRSKQTSQNNQSETVPQIPPQRVYYTLFA